ncbi:uncharacterized protein LOC126575146 [Anopheles aquasalis]|uniref:uncharacterized protein LOC126575146 n=1 Tax=Anopheles aquasalis TaxID=42839 RepID=UPI00215B5EF4|nr:uncharacterized protein LOC126575146 [Anopheles aquasalis]
MTNGYKHLYSVITFAIFLLVINFYKNRVNLNREREASFRAASKMKRAGVLNKPLPLDVEGADFFFGLEQQDDEDGHEVVMGRHAPHCLEVDIFFLPASGQNTPKGTRSNRGTRERRGSNLKPHDRITSKETAPGDQQQSTSPTSMYVFLSVLLILVFAACVDIAKHLTTSGRNGTPTDAQRRLSLQNYQALIREKQKQFRMMKQHCSQPSMSIQRSIDESCVPSGSHMPYPGYGAGAGYTRTNDWSTKPGPGTSSGPAPLLRRQSVPTLMRSPPSTVGGNTGFRNGAAPSTAAAAAAVPPAYFARRTSVDSFWDSDHLGKTSVTSQQLGNGSSPEVRRRVRMLHRH